MTESAGRVLVVDDETDLAESCAYFLERAGYEAECAALPACARLAPLPRRRKHSASLALEGSAAAQAAPARRPGSC